MRKVLYSGAWNADVWLHLFPMSLADRSFDSDGNCVCVCVCVCAHLGRPLFWRTGSIRLDSIIFFTKFRFFHEILAFFI